MNIHAAYVLLAAAAAGCAVPAPTSGTSGVPGPDVDPAPIAVRPAAPPVALESPRADAEPATVAPSAAPLGAGVLSPRTQGEAHRRRASNPWELVLNGVGANDEDFDAGGFNVVGSVAYYFTEMLSLAVRQGASMFDPGRGTPTRWDGSTRVAFDVHFPIEVFVPYIGVSAGYVYGDSIDETFAAGPEAGARFYVKPDTFLLVSAEYLFFFDETDTIQDAFDEGTFLYGLGFGIRF